MAEREKLTSEKLAKCPHLKLAITDALGSALYRQDSNSTHRECQHCRSNEVFVAPTEDKEGFPGRQHFEVTIQSVGLLSTDKADVENGCTFEPQPVPNEKKVLQKE